MENYETLGTIGEGTYGVVLKARHKETGQIVAIKKFKESDEDEQVRKTALREVRILKQLKHDNIVNLIEVFRRKGKLHLVFEFVERTILEDLERNPDGMDPLETKKCLWQLLRSIDYCHSHHVIHRDIKPENLLVSRNGTLKLCDFGFARTLAGPGARYTDYVATRWYRGPELLTGDTAYGKPVDIWAIGCMLPEMASGAPLFPGESDIDQLFHIMRCFGNLPPRLMEVFRANPLFIGIKLPENVTTVESLEKRFPQWDEDQLSFMQNCLKYEPEARCTCAELMQHPYFTEDGFVQWFDEELKLMLDRDSQDFKMRQKKFRKAGKPGKAGSSSGASNSGAREEGAGAPAVPSLLPPAQLSHAEHSSEFAPPIEERRPATREGAMRASEGGARVSDADSDGSGHVPMLPQVGRPSTPRAQRLVAFPQLSSALEDAPAGGSNIAMPGSRLWGNGNEPPPPPKSFGGGGGGFSNSGFASSTQRTGGSSIPSIGGRNLPQLHERETFSIADLPDRPLNISVGAAPPSRGGVLGKKKTPYDSSTPYGKPQGKLKKQSSKAGQYSGGAMPQMGGMGVVGQGQAHSLSGLSAAYGGSTASSHSDAPLMPLDGHAQWSGHSHSNHNPYISGQHGSSYGYGSTMQGSRLQSSSNYGGGQYAKYGKRY